MRAAAFGALLLTLLPACSEKKGELAAPPVVPSENTAPFADAGNAPSVDARLPSDTGAEAEAEAGYNLPSLPGAWAPVPGAPSWCGERISREPAKAFPAMEWKACPSGRAGCAVFDPPWPKDGYHDALVWRGWNEPLLRDGKPFFQWSFYLGTVFYRVVAPFDGPAIFVHGRPALDNPPPCGSLPIVGEAGVLHSGLAYTSWQDDAGIVADWSAWCPDGRPDGCNVFPTRDGDMPTGLSTAVLSGTLAYMALSPRSDGSYQTVATFDATNGRILRDLSFYAIEPLAVPDGAFVLGGSVVAQSLWLVRPDASHERLAKATRPGDMALQTGVDRARDNRLVWTEGVWDGGTPYGLSLWVAAYAPHENQLQRRRIGDFPDYEGGARWAVHDGSVLVVLRDGKRGLVVDVDTATAWVVPGEPDRVLHYPLWVDRQSVWFNTASDTRNRYQTPTDSLLRIDRATLGPGVPLASLVEQPDGGVGDAGLDGSVPMVTRRRTNVAPKR